MTTFVVEHRPQGHETYHISLVPGVEDLDTSQFSDILGIWVCDSLQEATVTISELYKLRGKKTNEVLY